MNYLKGIAGGGAAGAGATAVGESVGRAAHDAKDLGAFSKGTSMKDRISGLSLGAGAEATRRGEQISKVKGMITDKAKDVKEYVKSKLKKENSASFEETLYNIAQEKLYKHNAQ